MVKRGEAGEGRESRRQTARRIRSEIREFSVTVLAGGVGAAKFIRGLVRVIKPARLSVVVNTGDDQEFFGLHVCPDIDTVIYTLAGISHPLRGWGRAGDTFFCLEELGTLYGSPWFRLGDRDLATHIFRSDRLARGMSLSSVTAALGRALGIEATVIPMSDQRVRTLVITSRGKLTFQEYFVKEKTRPRVKSVVYQGIQQALPAPGAVESILRADAVVLAPSNPVASIGPILAVPGVRQALARTKAPVAAVSPIVAGRAVSGPAARMMRAMGARASASGVADLYRPFLDLVVVDRADRHDAVKIEHSGTRALVTDIMIPTASRAAVLARRLLEAMQTAGMGRGRCALT